MDTPRSRATSGRMPMMTNSVVPIAKAASANARIGSGSRGVEKVKVVFVRGPYASLADGTELLQKCQVVLEMPVLGNAPIGDAVDVGRDEVDRSTVALTCSGSVAEDPREVAAKAQAADHAVAHHEHLFNLDVQVWHGCAEILRRE